MKEIRAKVCPNCNSIITEKTKDPFDFNWCPSCKYNYESYKEKRIEVLEFAKKNYTGYRKGNEGEIKRPSVVHAISVVEILRSKGFLEFNYYAGALLHDLIEDTKVTYEDILEKTNKEVAQIVQLLTKEEDYNNRDYLGKIKENKFAKTIKCADRLSNLIETSFLDDNHLNFKKKYLKESVEDYKELFNDTPFEFDFILIVDKIKKDILSCENNK